MDPLVIQTIKLLHHQRFLLQLISRAQVYGSDTNAALPQFPEDSIAEKKAAKFHNLNFLPYMWTPFTSGSKKVLSLEIEANTARLILRKSIITLFAHMGFVDATESVVRVLVDVVHEFICKLTQCLRLNMDTMLESGRSPCEDILDHTLHSVGIQGIVALHHMYKERVILYHARVRQKTQQLHSQYQAKFLHGSTSIISQTIKKERTVSGDTFQEDSSGYSVFPLKSEDAFSKLLSGTD